MKKDTAKAILDMADRHTRQLIALLRVVEDNCTELERKEYIRGLGQVLGNLHDVMEYIYREHPEFEPEELKLEYINIPFLENSIATRELWTRDEQGNKTSVSILLGAPVRNERSGEYDCSYQIRGRGNNRTHRRSGTDPMEALMKAIRAIGWELRVEREKKGKKIWWRDENDTLQDLGFPVPNGPHR